MSFLLVTHEFEMPSSEPACPWAAAVLPHRSLISLYTEETILSPTRIPIWILFLRCHLSSYTLEIGFEHYSVEPAISLSPPYVWVYE